MTVHDAGRTGVLSNPDGPTHAPTDCPDAQRLLDSTGEGIYGVDTRGVCTFVNRSAAEMLGYEPPELVGRNAHALIHHSRDDGSPYPPEECPVYGTFRAGHGVRVEGELFWRRDGTSFPTRYSAFPILDGGAVTGAVVTFSDVTESRRVLEAARRAQEELEGGVKERIADLTAANLRLEAEVRQRRQAEAETGRLLGELEAERARLEAVLHQLGVGTK